MKTCRNIISLFEILSVLRECLEIPLKILTSDFPISYVHLKHLNWGLSINAERTCQV